MKENLDIPSENSHEHESKITIKLNGNSITPEPPVESYSSNGLTNENPIVTNGGTGGGVKYPRTGSPSVTIEPKFPPLKNQELSMLPSVKKLVNKFSTSNDSCSTSPTPPVHNTNNDKIIDRVEKVARSLPNPSNFNNMSNFKVF